MNLIKFLFSQLKNYIKIDVYYITIFQKTFIERRSYLKKYLKKYKSHHY